ncbi:hypothetical protein [Vibrio fortis]|uniref:hypothetical protein n=1 Tax=Vibrio fortis TaxID=212667 RepID=UPI0038CD9994
MPRYQFFTYPHNQITDFTYLDVDSEYYITNKQTLIAQQFLLDGAPVVAGNAKEAIEKYNRNFSRVGQEQAKASASYILIKGLLGLWKRARQRQS